MEPTLEELKVTYSKFSDDALIKLASEEASSLRPEAQTALKEEMILRNFPIEVAKSMELNTAPVDQKYCWP